MCRRPRRCPRLPTRRSSDLLLDGVNLGANFAVANNATLNVKNGLTLSNNARITLASDFNPTRLNFGSGTQTLGGTGEVLDRKSTRLNSSHIQIEYAVAGVTT